MGNNVTITSCVNGKFIVRDKSVDSLTINCDNTINLKTLIWGRLVIINPVNMHHWVEVDKDVPTTKFTVEPHAINPTLNPTLNKFRVRDDVLTILEFPEL